MHRSRSLPDGSSKPAHFRGTSRHVHRESQVYPTQPDKAHACDLHACILTTVAILPEHSIFCVAFLDVDTVFFLCYCLRLLAYIAL